MHDKHDWAGVCAVILALGLSIGWATAVIIATTPWHGEFSDAAVEHLDSIGQVLAGSLATYLGTRIARDRKHPED